MIEINQEFDDFIKKHRSDDIAGLRLHYHGKECPPWLDMALTHLECLRKAGKKFGDLQPRLMLNPLSVEQSTSSEVAETHGRIAREIFSDSHVRIADMTCGMGIDLLAVCRKLNAEATGFEMNPKVAEATAWNLKEYSSITIQCADSVKWLKDYSGEPIDLIFIDPARRDDSGGRVYGINDCTPDLTELLPLLRRKCRYAMAKLSPMLDITATLRDLPETKDLYVIGNNRECVELFAVMSFSEQPTPSQSSITIISDAAKPEEKFIFTREEEAESDMIFGEAKQGQWLFEPSACAMKAAPFRTLCSRHNLAALHPNTHLFVADAPIDSLPGKWYKIEEVIPFSSSTLKETGKKIRQADVAVRNFPIQADELAKRMKIKAGGNHRLIGITQGSKNGADKDCRLLIVLKK